MSLDTLSLRVGLILNYSLIDMIVYERFHHGIRPIPNHARFPKQILSKSFPMTFGPFLRI